MNYLTMPILYPTRQRRRLKAVDLEKLKQKLLDLGYKFIRDGGFRPEDEPFKWCNYLFYKHPEKEWSVRIGYDYPLLGRNNVIFEICYAKPGDNWWRDIIPDYRKQLWKDVLMDNVPSYMEWREKYRNSGKYKEKAKSVKRN